MKKKKLFLFSLTLLILIQLACIVSFKSSEEDQLRKDQTAVAETVQAIEMLDEQPKPELPLPTDTTEPQVPTQPQPPTKTPKPCNDAEYISSGETIPDGTKFDPGDAFTKSWRFKNVGTCTWNTNYKLVYKSGDQMGAPAVKHLSGDVAPGETVDIAINMTAPSTGGTYKSYWKLVDDTGEAMIKNIWVEIEVKQIDFKVTSVSISALPPVFAGPCPFPFQFQANITTNGPGTVTYYWKRSDGGTFGNASVNFASADTKTVSIAWPQIISGTHWMKIYIDEPNHQLFGTANYTLSCIP